MSKFEFITYFLRQTAQLELAYLGDVLYMFLESDMCGRPCVIFLGGEKNKYLFSRKNMLYILKLLHSFMFFHTSILYVIFFSKANSENSP